MTRRTAAESDVAPPTTEEDIGANARRTRHKSTAEQATAGKSDVAVPGEAVEDSDHDEDRGVRDSGAANARGARSSALAGLARPATVIAAPAVLALAGLSAAAIVLAVAHRDSGGAGNRDIALLGAVRQEVVNLISPSAKDSVASTDRIAADATGPWLTEFQGTKAKFVSAINDSQTDSVGRILGAGIERHNPDGSTTVLVSAVSKVSNSEGAKNDPRTWRLRVDVVQVGGAYKLSKVEVVP